MGVINAGERPVRHRHQSGVVHSHRGGWAPHSHPRPQKPENRQPDETPLENVS